MSLGTNYRRINNMEDQASVLRMKKYVEIKDKLMEDGMSAVDADKEAFRQVTKEWTFDKNKKMLKKIGSSMDLEMIKKYVDAYGKLLDKAKQMQKDYDDDVKNSKDLNIEQSRRYKYKFDRNDFEYNVVKNVVGGIRMLVDKFVFIPSSVGNKYIKKINQSKGISIDGGKSMEVDVIVEITEDVIQRLKEGLDKRNGSNVDNRKFAVWNENRKRLFNALVDGKTHGGGVDAVVDKYRGLITIKNIEFDFWMLSDDLLEEFVKNAKGKRASDLSSELVMIARDLSADSKIVIDNYDPDPAGWTVDADTEKLLRHDLKQLLHCVEKAVEHDKDMHELKRMYYEWLGGMKREYHEFKFDLEFPY